MKNRKVAKTQTSKNIKEGGFSLIECIIALGILAAALSWLSSIFLQQRLTSLKNESTVNSIKITQTILDDIRQRNLLKLPSESYVIGSGSFKQVCDSSTTVAQDPNLICPGSGVQATRTEELKQIFGNYHQAVIDFCPYDLETGNEYKDKKCTQDSRYIKVEIIDKRRGGAEADKYVTESFFTRFRE